MNKILLLRYNKVIDIAFEELSKSLDDVEIADITDFGDDMNMLEYCVIDSFISQFIPFQHIVVGDVFWPTGQHICNWSLTNKVTCCFMQHGQWIYMANKMDPRHVPSYTCLFGGNLRNKMQTWPYAKRSQVKVTGSPRYDSLPSV